jgi:hypothetical protein
LKKQVCPALEVRRAKVGRSQGSVEVTGRVFVGELSHALVPGSLRVLDGLGSDAGGGGVGVVVRHFGCRKGEAKFVQPLERFGGVTM